MNERNHERSNVDDESGWLPQSTRDAYTEWWETCSAADDKFQNLVGDRGEDLGDFVDGMATIRTFGPNPKTFPKGESS